MKELMENQNSIIFIDDFIPWWAQVRLRGRSTAANILKPALSRGEIQCIGATTPGPSIASPSRKIARSNGAFQAVKVPPAQ